VRFLIPYGLASPAVSKPPLSINLHALTVTLDDHRVRINLIPFRISLLDFQQSALTGVLWGVFLFFLYFLY
jgi:hypothetical protein